MLNERPNHTTKMKWLTFGHACGLQIVAKMIAWLVFCTVKHALVALGDADGSDMKIHRMNYKLIVIQFQALFVAFRVEPSVFLPGTIPTLIMEHKLPNIPLLLFVHNIRCH